MKSRIQTRIRSAALLAVIALLYTGVSGCSFLKPAKSTARHFVLTPMSPIGSATATPGSIAVGLGRVKIPAYLFNTSLAVRKGTNEIEYLPTTFWAERLDSGFQRVLAANLAMLLPTDRLPLSAWQRDQVVAEVYVTLEEFDVDASGRGVLVARWRILSPGGDQVLKASTSRLSRQGPPPDRGVSGSIDTLSALVADFAVQLAQALKEATSSPQAAPLSKRREQGGGPPAQLATREVGNHEQFEPFASCSAPVTQMFSEVREFSVHDYRARHDFERTRESNSEAPHRMPQNINT